MPAGLLTIEIITIITIILIITIIAIIQIIQKALCAPKCSQVRKEMVHKGKTVDKLDMRMIQQLQRINKQALAKEKFHMERNMHMQNIANRQRSATYESELARFENARLKGPLNTESYARLEKLKEMLKK